MRSLLVTLLLALAPLPAAAQLAPRSLALELAFRRDSSPALGSRVPLSLVATWWLVGDLDATARAGWAFAPRTGDRGADGSFEAGLGLRQGLARWGPVRPELVADAAFVQVTRSALSGVAAGLRLGLGAGLTAFLARDLSLGIVAEASELLLATDEGGPAVSVAVRFGACF
jgi:hypothetical protein